MNIYDERVIAGAKHLDRVKPGWAMKVDLETLDLCDGKQCVRGQVYGNYFIKGRFPKIGKMRNMGFALYSWDEQEAIEKAWKREVRKRQKEAKQ